MPATIALVVPRSLNVLPVNEQIHKWYRVIYVKLMFFKAYYCPQNSSAPIPCPPGHYCPYMSTREFKCPLGYYEQEGANQTTFEDTCYPCPAGTYGGDLNRQVKVEKILFFGCYEIAFKILKNYNESLLVQF